MDDHGFNSTKIIIPDGSYDEKILTDMDESSDFQNAMIGGGIGLHYPCNQPSSISHNVSKHKLKYWSSEDYSTEGNWEGSGCWGRILNQNVVKMNMTSTIAWSLIWSVYNDFPYYGNGLM
jgi:hypothetical protein